MTESCSRIAARLLASAFIATGLVSIAAGQGTSLFAEPVNCVQGEWLEPAECIAAHVKPKPDGHVTGQNSGCKSMSGICQAQGGGCNPDPTFNNAAKGKCQAYLGGSEVTKCAEDALKTAVTLTKVTGSCSTVGGDCGCKYSKAMPVETMNVEVCNCEQE